MSKRLFICTFLIGFLLAANGQLRGSFRFAQLTDIHLNPNNNEPSEDLLLAVNQINTTTDIDFVLVTGDITEEGDRTTMYKAKSILDRLKVNYYIIPGNHETKWSESGATDFGHIFGSERFKFEHKGFLFLGFNSGPLMRMAYGHIAPQDITWLKQELEKAGQDKPVILVTHYPMLEGDVDNWYEVTDAVRPYNIRAFIGGHYHRNRLLTYDGIPGILTRSTLRDKDGIGGYGVIDITPDSMVVYEQRIGDPIKRWGAFSLDKQYYDRNGKAEKYPDFSINNQYPQVKEKWLIKTGVGIYCSPAIYQNKVYTGDDMGFLNCYSLKDGKKLWSFKSNNRIVGTPDIATGIVVFGSADKKIYGLNARNRQELWEISASESVLGAVTIKKGIAYIGASDHTFRAIDIKKGKVIWSYDKVKGYIETKPLIKKNRVIFGAWDNTLYALDKRKGKELWKWTGGLAHMHFSPAAVWPVSAHNKVFIVDPQRAITAINLETGETIWRTFQSKVRESIGLSADKNRIYCKTMNDSIVCYSTTDNTPKQVWASDVGFGYEHAPSMQMEKNGIIFSSTKEGVIFALEARNGKLLWKHKIGNSLVNTVIPINSNSVLFTTSSGETGLLEWKKSKHYNHE